MAAKMSRSESLNSTPWELGALGLEVGRQRLLAQLQLLKQVRQHRPQRLIAAAHRDHIACVIGLGYDLHGR